MRNLRFDRNPRSEIAHPRETTKSLLKRQITKPTTKVRSESPPLWSGEWRVRSGATCRKRKNRKKKRENSSLAAAATVTNPQNPHRETECARCGHKNPPKKKKRVVVPAVVEQWLLSAGPHCGWLQGKIAGVVAKRLSSYKDGPRPQRLPDRKSIHQSKGSTLASDTSRPRKTFHLVPNH